MTGHGAVRYAQTSANTCFFSRATTVRWFTPGPTSAFRQDAEKILNEMETGESGKAEQDPNHEDGKPINSNWKPFEVMVMKDLPSQQLDELKGVIFTYLVMAPLLSALFADKIDNIFVVCLLFVGLVGSALVYFRNRLRQLEESLKEQERRLMELEGVSMTRNSNNSRQNQ